jgi:peptidoglycan/xylan/chitin deacetylase (PgdA/CDA1 family)
VPNEERIRVIEEMQRGHKARATHHPQLSTDDLRVLDRGGIAVGNHTWTHPCLNRCDPTTIRDEIEKAHGALAEALGEPPRWFAYPNGDWDEHAEQVLKDLNYDLGFLFDHRLADVRSSPLRVSRVRVNSDTQPDRLAIIMSGLHPWIHHGRGRA